MPAQKRKLSEADVDNSSRKQRYSSSLLFKPNVNLNTKRPAATVEPTNTVNPSLPVTNTTQQIENENVSTAASYLEESEGDLKVPKLSIRRKVNSDSQKSEFTIQSNLLAQAASQTLVFNRQDSSNESASDSSGEENEEDDENEVNEEVDNEEDLIDDDDDDDLDEDEIDDNEEEVEDEEEEEEEDEGDFDEDSTGTDSNSSNQNENSEAAEKTVSPIKISLKSYQNSKADKSSSKGVEVTNEDDNTKQERVTKSRVTKKPKSDSSEDAGAKKKRGRPAKEKPPKVDKTPRSITSYYVYCQVTRPIIAQKHPELKLRQQHRIVADMWSKLTDKEKLIWRHKAIKLRKKGSKGMISTGAVAKQQYQKQQQQESRVLVTPKPTVRTQQRIASAADTATNKPSTAAVSAKTKSPKLEEKTEKPVQSATENQLPSNLVNFVEDTKPIDLASYMTLLGESLTLIGTRLREHEGKYAVQGSSIVLLDSLLCALGPLVALTNQIEEMNGCPKEVLTNILENVSYIMPGL